MTAVTGRAPRCSSASARQARAVASTVNGSMMIHPVVTGDERDVRDVVTPRLPHPVVDLEQAVDVVELGLTPQARVDRVGLSAPCSMNAYRCSPTPARTGRRSPRSDAARSARARPARSRPDRTRDHARHLRRSCGGGVLGRCRCGGHPPSLAHSTFASGFRRNGSPNRATNVDRRRLEEIASSGVSTATTSSQTDLAAPTSGVATKAPGTPAAAPPMRAASIVVGGVR